MRCKLFCRICHYFVEAGQFQHQILLTGRMCCLNGVICCTLATLCIFFQNRFDTHDGIQDIWAGISFKGNKAVNIKDIVFGSLIG